MAECKWWPLDKIRGRPWDGRSTNLKFSMLGKKRDYVYALKYSHINTNIVFKPERELQPSLEAVWVKSKEILKFPS